MTAITLAVTSTYLYQTDPQALSTVYCTQSIEKFLILQFKVELKTFTILHKMLPLSTVPQLTSSKVL